MIAVECNGGKDNPGPDSSLFFQRFWLHLADGSARETSNSPINIAGAIPGNVRISLPGIYYCRQTTNFTSSQL
jgi:hypothetical protein